MPAQDDGDVALPPRVAELLAHPGIWATAPSLSAADLIARAEAAAAPDTGLSETSAETSRPSDSIAPGAVSAAPGASASAPAGPGGDGSGVVIPFRPRRRWVRPALAAAALVLVAAVATGVLATRETPSATIELAGATGAPTAHGEIRVIERDAGWRLVLDVQGLAPAGPGTYYQGWAIKDDEYVPLGTFHMHKAGQVELWSGVPLRQFRRIEVTSQRVGAGQDPGTLVLAGGMR
jgi:hypothetical protein